MSTIDIHLAQSRIEQEMPLFKDVIDPDERPRIKITYEITTPESAAQGDFADHGWIDEDGVSMVPDEYDQEEGLTAVDLAVKYLKDYGANEPSYFPGWTSGTWYTYNGEMDTSGEAESRSYHLEDFTPEQEQEIYRRVVGRSR